MSAALKPRAKAESGVSSPNAAEGVEDSGGDARARRIDGAQDRLLQCGPGHGYAGPGDYQGRDHGAVVRVGGQDCSDPDVSDRLEEQADDGYGPLSESVDRSPGEGRDDHEGARPRE